MTDFLLELRCEEIPARMQKQARADLEKLFVAQMGEAGLAAESVTVWSTPRRLALIARGLPDETQAVSEEAKGPPEGAPDQAVDGFCRKNGVTRDQLELRDVKGRATWFAVIDKPGRATLDVLAEAVPAIVRAFPWPKSMRWGTDSISTESLRWVRPLSGIVAIFGERLVECEVGGVKSGYATRGHRFMHEGVAADHMGESFDEAATHSHHAEITIGGAHDYAEKLRLAHVIVDQEEREAIVRDGAKKAAEAAGLTLVVDEGLVVENAGLTEWPVPLLGRFDESFLDVPPEVIQLTARVNQKYFVCEGEDGALANAFVCTANVAALDGGKAIVAGNEKVLAARLSDAKFFWDLDRKKTLEQHGEGLSRITFHEKLGTVADKVERVAKLARWLCEQRIVGGDPELAEQAARLCKADLVTEMVGEFPELQGLMGGYYARAEGLHDAVADAIRDHYKPVGQGDDVPTAPVTVAVSVADKLDTLVGFFAIDEKPTGSKDPFALRRAALANIRLIEQNALRVQLNSAFHKARQLLHNQPVISRQARIDHDEASNDQALADILDFFADRLKVQQKEAGVRHDLIDAVFALGGEDDLVRLLARVKALQAFVETDAGGNLAAAYKRAANILKQAGDDIAADVNAPADEPQASTALAAALDEAAPEARAAVEAEDFEGAMTALASLREPIDGFFDAVMVNDEDAAKRDYRLSLLARFVGAVHEVADFSKIEG